MKKRSTSVYDLAQGLPIQFGRYLEVVRNLGFEERPVEGYRQLLLSILDDLTECRWRIRLDEIERRSWRDLSINKKPNLHGYGHPNPPGERQRRHEAVNSPHRNQVAAVGGKDMLYNAGTGQILQSINGNIAHLDPTSFEAFQQQAQQKYALQQQRQQQQHMFTPTTETAADVTAATTTTTAAATYTQMVMGGVAHGPNMLEALRYLPLLLVLALVVLPPPQQEVNTAPTTALLTTFSPHNNLLETPTRRDNLLHNNKPTKCHSHQHR